MAERLLEVKGLKTYFFTDEGVVRAVDGIDFYINRGETLGIVGESGSGKSVTALSIMRLIPTPPGRIVAGAITYNGRNLLELPPAQMRKIRGKEISMIFQEPMTSLNPVFTVGEQVAEAVRLHQKKSRAEAMQVAIEMFKKVGIPAPEERVHNYPHQLSGGMRQRVMIAMALACKPDLLIAARPRRTSAAPRSRRSRRSTRPIISCAAGSRPTSPRRRARERSAAPAARRVEALPDQGALAEGAGRAPRAGVARADPHAGD